MNAQPILKYVIPGDPVALARARHTGRGTCYDSQKELKCSLGIFINNVHEDRPFYEGPLHLDIVFFMKIPKRIRTISPFHLFKPDLSNLIKFYEDIATGILYRDDCLISKITASKIYDKNPRTEFTVVTMKENVWQK